MPAIRKEQAVFLGAAALLGWMFMGDFNRKSVRVRSGGGERLELERHVVPDVTLALPTDDGRDEFRRDLFSPPSDTQPLPPLDLVPPPLEPLPAVAPPGPFGPAPAHFARQLRRDARVTPVDGLFEPREAAAAVGTPEGGSGVAAGLEEVVDVSERIAGYRRLYDWLRLPNIVFGHIRNADRYGLARRPEEAIEWVEVNPETGLEKFDSSVMTLSRERVTEFGFAETPANDIELRRHALGDELRPSQLEEALQTAQDALLIRNEVPRGIVIAEELYTMAEAVADGDPRPQLGLARCMELAFRFDDAFALYSRLSREIQGPDLVLVHARLADLLARFRLFDRAEEEFERALALSSQNWEARYLRGTYRLQRGLAEEAIEDLRVAREREPREPQAQAARTAIRVAVGHAELMAGRLDEARDSFLRALSGDARDANALAGLFESSRISGNPLPTNYAGELDRGIVGGMAGANFNLQLALGLAAMERGEWFSAERNLTLASEADPFRSIAAWRALSWLADRTGYEEEARQYISLAFEADPTDPWTLYQRGRLALLAEDEEGARESFEAALERAVDFVDVLAALADLARRAGRHEDASRYLERATRLDPAPAHLYARRGVALLSMGEVSAARDAFQGALASQDVATASAGLGWCSYAEGDSVEATTLLSDLADRRRTQPEDDPWRIWSEAQIARILDHDSKEVWVDRFERRAGDPAGGWMLELGSGPDVRLMDGRIIIDGQITSSARTRFWRPIASGDLVSFEISVNVDPATQARVGIFLSLERKGGAVESAVRAAASLSRNKDGGVQVRTIQSGNRDAPYVDVPGVRWPTGQSMPISIERSGEGNESDLTLYLDGVPVLESTRVAALGASTAELKMGVFVEGSPGRPVQISVDDVEVVRRRRR